jgi:hypothetical protein
MTRPDGHGSWGFMGGGKEWPLPTHEVIAEEPTCSCPSQGGDTRFSLSLSAPFGGTCVLHTTPNLLAYKSSDVVCSRLTVPIVGLCQ